MEAGRRRALPEVRAPRLPRAVVRHLAVVRVPVPRLAVQPGRREEGRPGAARPRPLRRRRSTAASSPSTPAPIIQGPPIGTNTTGQEAEGPHCITGRWSARDRSPPSRHRAIDRDPDRARPRASAGSSTSSSTSAQAKPEVGSEIELAPNRKPYFADEELEGRKLDRTLHARAARPARRHRRRPAALLAERAGPPGRRRSKDFDAKFVPRGARRCSPPPPRAASTAPAATAHEGRRAAPPRTRSPTRTAASSQVVSWKAPALNTVLLASADDEVTLHPHLRPPVLADAGVGRRRRRPDERPADRRTSSPTCRAIQLHARRRRRPRRSRNGARRQTRRPTPRCRRGQVRDGEALFNLEASTAAPTRAPAATPGLVLRRAAVVGRRRLRPEPHQRRRRSASSRTTSRPGRLRRTTAPSRASATASRARAPGRMPGFGADLLTPGADRGQSSTTSGASDDATLLALVHARRSAGTRDPRHPRRAHRRRRAVRQRLPAARHQPRRPARVPGRARRPLRLAVDHGRRSGGSTASASRARDPTWKPVEVIVGDVSTSRRRQRGRRATSTSWRRSSPTGRSRAAARRSPAADDDPHDPGRSVFASRHATTSSPTRARHGRRAPDPTIVRRFQHVHAFGHDPHYAVVQVQPVIAADDRARPGAADARSPTRRSRSSTVVMVRDLGYAAAARRSSITLGVGDHLRHRSAASLHRRDKAVDGGAATRQPAGERGVTGHGPVPADPRAAGPGGAVRRASASWRRSCWRRSGPNAGQGGALRVRHRARASEPPERFPVRFYLVAMIFIVFDIEIIFLYPFAVDLPGARRVRARRDGRLRASPCFVSFVYLIANGALDWGPVKRLRRARPPVGRRRAPPTTTIRRVGLEGRDAEPRGGSLMADATSERGPRGPRPQLPHRHARGPREVGPAAAACWPATFGLACCAIEMMAHRRRALRPRPLRHGGLPGLAPPGRPHDRRRPGLARRWRRCCARSTTR